jgi:hypothetical protein
VDNELYDFVPSGMYDPVPRDIIRTDTCNRCHDPLAMHGGRYREIGICTQCHNPGLVGRSDGLDRIYSLDVLAHKVHKELEDGYPPDINDCEVCHTGGTPTADMPLVANPNPIPVCDMSMFGVTELTWADPGTAVEIRVNAPDGPLMALSNSAGSVETGDWVGNGSSFWLNDVSTGQTIQRLYVDTTVLGCVGNAPGAPWGTPAAQHTKWLTNPSRAVCGSCHEDVNFETGENHLAGPLEDDQFCYFCHRPDSGMEYDASIRGAHTVLFKSAQFPGTLVEMIDIVDTEPGDTPTVTFSVGNKYGPLNPANVDRIRFTITGPNEDYSYYNQETVGSKAVPVGANWAYTFEEPLPLDAEGSYTVSTEGRHDILIDFGDGESDEEHDTIEATNLAFKVTGDSVMPRREVVDDYKCESCHTNLALHGGGRTNANVCITCHRPDLIGIEPEESAHMKYMIHKIHRGEELENGFVIVRSRGTYDFSHVEYPGDLRNCEACHVNDSYLLPLPEGLLPTTTPKELMPETLPIAATCLSCHDSDDAKTHALAQTTFFGESCGACHGDGMSFSVDKLHAR